MTRQEKIGVVLATIAGLMGVIGHYYTFLNWYHRGMAAEAAEPGCEILLKWIHPALTDVGLLAGVIFIISAYGFFTRHNWAFPLSVIAIVLACRAVGSSMFLLCLLVFRRFISRSFGRTWCCISCSYGWSGMYHGPVS
jgi:hypothetical protein